MPTIEFDTTLPSTRQVQNLIKDKNAVEMKLLTGDTLNGSLVWQDPNCILLVQANGQKTTIWKQAIAYMKPLE
ncbi:MULTISPECIES: Hfq-related RNA-binding protein [Cyanophyceae]|uniref:Hfq-related RNA-binding protein n=1 Tax=Cyanophyceae TaxID=3028117 RepID=UPI000B498637|nr:MULTISPECIES: RNA chaperone Hfq [Cyanophyceae]NQZ65434.1 RNA chaperone Hfq [Crocosphaera sp.]